MQKAVLHVIQHTIARINPGKPFPNVPCGFLLIITLYRIQDANLSEMLEN